MRPGRCQSACTAYCPCRMPNIPALIIEEARHQLTWATLEAMAEPLAYLIGRRDYARTLRWAAERTRRVNAPIVELGDDDVAEICDVTGEDVQAMARRIQSALTPLLYRLYPVVVYYADAETAAAFDPEAPAVESEAEARDMLAPLADRLETRSGQAARCRARRTEPGSAAATAEHPAPRTQRHAV